jgi:hypothetical protein
MKRIHRRGAEIAEVKIILFSVEAGKQKNGFMACYIFLASQQKYIIILSASLR